MIISINEEQLKEMVESVMLGSLECLSLLNEKQKQHIFENKTEYSKFYADNFTKMYIQKLRQKVELYQ